MAKIDNGTCKNSLGVTSVFTAKNGSLFEFLSSEKYN